MRVYAVTLQTARTVLCAESQDVAEALAAYWWGPEVVKVELLERKSG